jgi:hypothetical protein
MKTKLLILLLFCWTFSFGQSVPNTSTFTLGQVTLVIYGDSTVGRNTSTIFADSDETKFDATYGSKTMSPQTINGFRNYGACTRPGSLYDFDLKYMVNGTHITSVEACDPSGLAACGSCLGYMGRVSAGGEGSDVYLSNGTSDCTKVPDGYYVSWQTCGTDCWQWVGFQIIAGKWYYVYC